MVIVTLPTKEKNYMHNSNGNLYASNVSNSIREYRNYLPQSVDWHDEVYFHRIKFLSTHCAGSFPSHPLL